MSRDQSISLTALGLLDLPNDLFRDIVEDLIPESYEDFMLTCKSFYSLGIYALEEYQNLKRTYRDYGRQGRDETHHSEKRKVEGSATHLLLEIARNPRIARYVVTLRLREVWLSQVRDYGLVRDPALAILNTLRVEEASTGSLMKLLRRNEYLEAADQEAERWIDNVFNQPYTYASVLLLTMLPNVEELELPTIWRSQTYASKFESDDVECDIWRVLGCITSKANEAGAINASLAKLKSLMPIAISYGWENAAIDAVFPFLAINSLETFTGESFFVYDEEKFDNQGLAKDDISWRYFESFGANLSHVELNCCVVQSEAAFELTTRLPALSSLKYFHGSDRSRIDSEWVSARFIDSISRGCGNRLLSLSVMLSQEPKDIVDISPSFKGFGVLRHLDLDTRLFSRKNSPQIFTLVDLLPVSIQNLSLVALARNDQMAQLRQLFERWNTWSPDCHPTTTKVHLDPPSQSDGREVASIKDLDSLCNHLQTLGALVERSSTCEH